MGAVFGNAGPEVALPSLGNLDPADPALVHEQYRLQILERDVVGFRFNVDAAAGAETGNSSPP